MPSPDLRLDDVRALYRRYADDLAAVVDQQRAFLARSRRRVVPQLDDVEAELTYLLVRDRRPQHVVEVGTFYGWSTTWLLSALRDNGAGHLHSFDVVDHVRTTVPGALAGDRWTFHHGDVRDRLGDLPARTDHLFVDADHRRSFAEWYLRDLVPRVPAGVLTSVHDVYHGRRARRRHEGGAVVEWLARRRVPHFTAARRHVPEVFAAVEEVRAELGLRGARGTTVNPMIWFHLP